MLKHRFISRLSSVNEVSSDKRPSFSSYINSLESPMTEDCQDEPEIQIFEKPILEKPILVKPIPMKPSLERPKLQDTGIPNSGSKQEFSKVQGLRSDDSNINKVSEMLNELRQGNNLAKFLESHGLSTSAISVPQLKEAFEQFLSKQSVKKKEISKWDDQLNNLRELTDDHKLEAWLESVGVKPSQVSLPLVKQEIKRYFNAPEKLPKTAAPFIDEPIWGKKLEKNGSSKEKSNLDVDEKSIMSISETEFIPEILKNQKIFGRAEPLENYKGRSLIYQENTLAKKIWDDFKEMSPAKQVAIVVGITVVTAAVGFVSWRILIMMFPRVLSMNHYWTEVLAQWFIQRQDTAFQLLIQHSENAKPLSTAWANQYILWKYI